jgi:DNA-binding transcriptional LysR family regulator
MHFRQFEALYWIGRLGSFHAAARHLRTSQPAISARIRELELQLSVPIFDRSERRARLTAKGRELLRYAEKVVTIAAEIRALAGEREALTGRVRLGVTAVSAVSWVPELLGRVAQDFPRITVEITVETSDVLLWQTARDELDLAVMLGPIASPKVQSETLGQVSLGWLASPRLDLPETPMSAADIASFPVIIDRAGTHLYDRAMNWFRAEGVEPGRHHASSALSTRIELAVRGIGIALAATAAAEREIARQTLRIVATTRPMPALEYNLTWPKSGHSPAARVVADLVRVAVIGKGGLEQIYAPEPEPPIKAPRKSKKLIGA